MSLRYPLLAACSTLALTAVATAAPSVETTAPHDAPAPGATTTAPDRDGDTSARGAGAPPLMPGWPETMGQTAPFAPVGVLLADLDRNGSREVIAGSTDNLLRAWTFGGGLLGGFPVNVGGQIQSKAAAGDLDGDGDLEIVVAIKNGEVRAYHRDGTLVTGWPQTSGLIFGFLSPVLYDLDGDEMPEVLIGGGTNQNVHAWHGDGTVVTGFPVPLGATIIATLAVGDVAGDASPEIVALAGGSVHVLAADGSTVAGFPQSYGLSGSYAAPSIGDIDGAGGREILAVGYEFGSFTRIHAYHGDGTQVTGFPVQYPSLQTYSCPVIGDVDGDGDLELFNAGKVNAAPTFYAWDHTGAVLTGWPTPGGSNMEGSAVLANQDADAELEVVIADNADVVLGYDLDGTVADGYPFMSFGSSLPDAPSLADVDGDGDMDLALTAAPGQVALWDLDVPWDPDAVEWGELFHDRYNTNQHGFVPPEPVVTSVADAAVAPPVRLGAVAPNPFRAGVHAELSLDRPTRVRAAVYDAAGREVRRLADVDAPAGTLALSWDGRDAREAPAPPGVYFLRVETNAGSAAQRIVRL